MTASPTTLAPISTSPPATAGRARITDPFVVAAVLGTVVLTAWRAAEQPWLDGDPLWGIRAGLTLLHTGVFPHTDPYSWTMHGKPWTPNSWGWNVVLALAYRAGGLTGLTVLIAVGAAVTAALALRAAVRFGASPVVACIIFLALDPLLSGALSARAQLVDYPIALVVPELTLLVLATPRRATAWRATTGLALLCVVWMNLHSSALLAVPLIAVTGAGHAVTRPGARRTVLLRTVGLTALAAVCCLATPYGITPITHAGQVRAASVGLIVEWAPVNFGPGGFEAMIALAAGVAALGFALRLRRLDTCAQLLLFGAATASAIRFTPFLLLVAIPVIATMTSRVLRSRLPVRVGWSIAATVLALLCVVRSSGIGNPGDAATSPRLIAEIPAGCRLLNDFEVGGDILLLRPDVRVSIDSRNDMYGRSQELANLHAFRKASTGRSYLRRYGVTCVLAETDAPLVRALRHDPTWRILGHDALRTLLVRR